MKEEVEVWEDPESLMEFGLLKAPATHVVPLCTLKGHTHTFPLPGTLCFGLVLPCFFLERGTEGIERVKETTALNQSGLGWNLVHKHGEAAHYPGELFHLPQDSIG